MGTSAEAAADAAEQAAAAAAKADGGVGPCGNTDDDEGCEVDWDVLFGSVDGADRCV